MVDLEMVLRRYGDDLDERCPPVTPERLERHLEVSTPDDEQHDVVVLPVAPDEWRTGSRRRYRLAIAGVAAALVLLVVVIMTGGDNGSESETFTDVPSPDPQPTLEPSPSPPAEEVDWDAYFAEIVDSSLLLSEEPAVYQLEPGPEPQFDTSALGTEIVFEPVSANEFAEFERPLVPAWYPEEDLPEGPLLFVGQVPDEESEESHLAVYQAETGQCTARFLGGSLVETGCGSALQFYGPDSSGGTWDLRVFVPVDSSVVAISTLEGERMWQRPNGGWAVFDTPGWPEGGPSPAVVAYDAAGNSIARWGSSQAELDAWAESRPKPTAEESSALVEEYFDAHNAGNFDALLALIVEPGSPGWGSVHMDVYGPAWQRFLLDSAQGTILRSPACTAADGRSLGDTVVTCVYDILDAPTQAVGATPVSATAVFTVSEHGITQIEESYGDIDFSHVREPFRDWLRANRPSATCLDELLDGQAFLDCFTADFREPERFGNADQLTELGLLVGRYSEEWAAFLEQAGCSYLDGC